MYFPTHESPETEYVLGFAFDQKYSRVLLINKNKPGWQAGLKNGVGGKIETYDPTVAHAMVREFEEETSIETETYQWKLFAQHAAPTKPGSFHLHVLSIELTADQSIHLAHPTTELPEWVSVSRLSELLSTGVSGVVMYIAMALNHRNKPLSTMTLETPLI